MTRKQSNTAVLEPPTTHSPAAAQPHPATPPSHRAGRALAPRFGIDEDNLAVRREFIRLGEADRKLLAKLEPWAARVAAEIAREFYDWQFQFAPTLAFFEAFAASRQNAARRRAPAIGNFSGRLHPPHLQRCGTELGRGVLRGPAQCGLDTRPDQSSVQVVYRFLHRDAAPAPHPPAPRFQRGHRGSSRRGDFQGLQLRHAGHRRFVPAQHAGIDGPQRRSHRGSQRRR